MRTARDPAPFASNAWRTRPATTAASATLHAASATQDGASTRTQRAFTGRSRANPATDRHTLLFHDDAGRHQILRSSYCADRQIPVFVLEPVSGAHRPMTALRDSRPSDRCCRRVADRREHLPLTSNYLPTTGLSKASSRSSFGVDSRRTALISPGQDGYAASESRRPAPEKPGAVSRASFPAHRA